MSDEARRFARWHRLEGIQQGALPLMASYALIFLALGHWTLGLSLAAVVILTYAVTLDVFTMAMLILTAHAAERFSESPSPINGAVVALGLVAGLLRAWNFARNRVESRATPR